MYLLTYLRFMGWFWCCFHWFFFGWTRDCPFSLSGSATILVILLLKIVKTPDIGGKVCVPHFVFIAEILIKFHCRTIAPRTWMCSCMIFSACHQQLSKFALVVQKWAATN